MAIEQQKVWEIVRQAVSKSVDIPEFQREFVWDPEQVKRLAESLYRDYPIGSFLLWDCSDYEEAKTAKGTLASRWIVDGQQRTTALCLLLGEKPYWWADAKEWNEALKRYDVLANVCSDGPIERMEFGLPNPVRRLDPRWISVRRVLSVSRVEDLTPLAQEIAERIAGEPKQAMELFGVVHARLERLWQIRGRDIPTYKVSHELEDVAEIFARLNQAGTRVKEADVVLALAAVHNPGWVREEYLPFRNELEDRGWDLDAGVFIRTMAAIGRGRARLKEVPEEFWSSESLKASWSLAKDTMVEVLRRLGEVGIVSAEILPSTNSLIPLFVLHHRWSDDRNYSFGKAFYWFLLANRDGRYSGAAITSLNEDVRAIVEAGSFKEAIDSLRGKLRVSGEIADGEFLSRYDRGGNKFLRMMLYLVLFGEGARDWVDGTRIGYDGNGSVAATGFEPQWHHIYPRGLLKKAGVRDDEVHFLANITVLNERTNVNKLAGKAPWSYIKQFGISGEELRCHLIPESFGSGPLDEAHLRERWSVDRYTELLLERSQLLAKAANELLKRWAEH